MLSGLQCIGQPPTTECPAQNVSNTKIEKSWPKARKALIFIIPVDHMKLLVFVVYATGLCDPMSDPLLFLQHLDCAYK